MFIITIKYLKRSILLAVSSFSFSTAMAAEKPEFNNPIFTATAAEQCEFNKHLLNKQIRESHLHDIDVSYYNSMNDIRVLNREISKYIQYKPKFDTRLNPQFNTNFMAYFNEIINNIVGNTMLRLLIANMENEEVLLRIKATTKYPDHFDAEKNKVYLNPTNYDLAGITIRPSCALDTNGQLVPKYNSLGDVIFHELCHALYRYGKKEQTKCKLLDKVYEELQVDGTYKVRQEKYLWTNDKSKEQKKCEDDEELYTMTGYFDGGFDPINCNMYDICKCVSNNEPIIQRVFHDNYEQLQQKIRNKEITNPPYGTSEFLINLDDYIIPKCNEPNQVVDQSEYSALPPLSPHKQPEQSIEQDKPAPLQPLPPSRRSGQAVKPNKPTPATTPPQPAPKFLKPQSRHVPTILQIRGKPKQPQLPPASKCWPPIVTLVFAKE
jgi:hypothetical protein